MKIVVDDISRLEVVRFLNDHLQHMIEVTPPGCVHALDIDALKRTEITFWTVWEGSLLICCGALKELNTKEAELKSMRTVPSYLETGSYKTFEPARKLYEKFGFEHCGTFSDYVENANSVYMVLKI